MKRFLRDRVEVHHGDCRDVLRTLPGASVDSVVCDPPYELNFMGKGWDASGIANNVDMWREVLRVLKPGGHLLTFSGSRTYHRMVCAIEDAGFEVRDQIMWLYGSGFPKSHNGPWGGTALKPAHEPIVVARKPLQGTVAQNVLEWGTGALNIDGCRVGAANGDDYGRSAANAKGTVNAHEGFEGKSFKIAERDGEYASPLGRWPANVIHDGSPEVRSAFAAFGESKSTGDGKNDTGTAARFFASFPPTEEDQEAWNRHVRVAEGCLFQCHPISDGSALSNVQSLPPPSLVQNVKSAGAQCDLCATAIAHGLVELRRNRNAASLQFPAFISEHNARTLRHSLALYAAGREDTDTILTTAHLRMLLGFVSHAIAESTHTSADELLASQPKSSRFWYDAKADADDRIGSRHPTIKPVSLMQYLVRLITPPNGVVLDPFAGTGTTGEAAYREEMRAILIEREDEYQADIERRMALVLAGPDEKRRNIIKQKTKDKPVDHGPLFSGLDVPASEPQTRRAYGRFAEDSLTPQERGAKANARAKRQTVTFNDNGDKTFTMDFGEAAE